MSTPAKFRKKPVVIDAMRWDGVDIEAALSFISDGRPDFAHLPGDGVHVGSGIGFTPYAGTLDIPTLEGTMTARPGDWIIRGVAGEFYPCRSDIFEATYEAAPGENP